MAFFLLRIKTLIYHTPTVVVSLTLQMIIVKIAVIDLTRDEKKLLLTMRG